ncbi:MAG TPA: subclass B1 metallo-beta-lactamase [Puia sp.]|nr:subclass B1 metallo-beta-lactamase [Puia sp.]
MKPILFLVIYLSLTGTAAIARAQSSPARTALSITHLTGNVYVYTTYGNPGDGSSYPSNSLYIVTTNGIVLLDTPWDTTQFQPLVDSLYARYHEKPVLCLSTHFHDDRTAGLDFFRQHGVDTWSSAQTRELCRQKGKPQAEHVFTKDTVFTIGGHTFRTFYPGEGYTKDNIVVWIEKERVLYGGCFVKSTETQSLGNLADAGIEAWPASVKRVLQAFPNPAFVIPGHLGWADKKSLEHTLKLLDRHRRMKQQ